MKQLLSALMVAFVALTFAIEDAEAARLGGGRSVGTQRSVAPTRSVQQTPPSQAAPAAPAAAPAPGAAPQPAGNRWLGPVAGLAAGLGLGYLLGHGGLGGLGGMMGTLLIMALVGFAVVFVIRRFSKPRTEGNLQYAGMANEPASAPPSALASGIGAAPAFGGQSQPNIPAGFDTEGFLRQAKLNFVKLQAVHDSGKLGELREFTTDAMFESIKQDLLQHGGVAQQTDVVTLNAELLEALTEGDSHWASVRFYGMIREQINAQPEAFEEVWNLAKPVSGATGWVLAGIQQIQ
ncbi:MAG: Tim44 domain-containing protein [Betaproteobacteria bacterium]|nr:MAG: Tim44 domain-containing protein [Betaproteobacteria bacterium]